VRYSAAVTLTLELQRTIRDVPDFPKPGIVFKDITPVLMNAGLFGRTLDALAEPWKGGRVDAVVAIESRGFLFGAGLAERLSTSLVLVRKAGKLPYKTIREAYALEYGEAVLELHTDALESGQRVLIVDDLLATGGTAAATAQLVGRQGAVVAGFQFVIELGFLDGGKRLGPTSRALVRY
jgi:adenine phosphoribosyltransferase